MNEEVKAQWITALRSGEYEQGEHFLQTNEGFCCLGVLCDIAVKNEVIPEPIIGSLGTRMYGEQGNGGTLPDEVVEWAELDEDNPYVDHPNGSDLVMTLAGLNDEMGYDFEEIADVIEEQL